jgi:peptidoglycan/xylan/chitin deacetylase (PgdA/CDA1 family)
LRIYKNDIPMLIRRLKAEEQKLLILLGFFLTIMLSTGELATKTHLSIEVDMFYQRQKDFTLNDQRPKYKSTWDNVIVRIDDGPDRYTSDIVKTLKEIGVKNAIFSLIGKNVLKYPDTVQEILDAGYIIANHTFTHPKMHLRRVRAYYEQNPGKWIEQVTKTTKVINRALKPKGKPYQCKLFCCPEGSIYLSIFLKEIVKEQGFKLDRGWDIDSRDSINGEKRLTQEQIVSQITYLHNKKNYVKVLIHSRKGGWSVQLREIDKILTNSIGR